MKKKISIGIIAFFMIAGAALAKEKPSVKVQPTAPAAVTCCTKPATCSPAACVLSSCTTATAKDCNVSKCHAKPAVAPAK